MGGDLQDKGRDCIGAQGEPGSKRQWGVENDASLGDAGLAEALHFLQEETEAQGGEGTYPRPRSIWGRPLLAPPGTHQGAPWGVFSQSWGPGLTGEVCVSRIFERAQTEPQE